MSEIDDDFDRRLQERQLLEKQRFESAKQAKAVEDSKFAKLVANRAGDEVQTREQKDVSTELTGRAVIEKAKAYSERLRVQGVDPTQQNVRNRKGGLDLPERRQHAEAALSRAFDKDEMEGMQKGRQLDFHGDDDRLSERKESSEQGSASTSSGSGSRGKDGLSTDSDGAGKNGGGTGERGGDEQGSAGSFRFNPALMAPVPVAQPRPSLNNEKLRALANEIAQKIVESVRVGTNRLGEAEFQIELKSSVLSGLQIKVSGGNGKISAVFSGSDPEVLKLIRQNADGLKQALNGRGLVLVDLQIEERK